MSKLEKWKQRFALAAIVFLMSAVFYFTMALLIWAIFGYSPAIVWQNS